MINIKNRGLFLFSAFAGLMVLGRQWGFTEIIGKSIAVVNGEAIYLSEYQSNFDALMEQRRRMSSDQRSQIDWEKDTRKALLDQMIDEKLLLMEAKKRDLKVPKRQVEEGIQQVKNRFKNIPQGKKPTKEDYERPLTEKENAEFLKELKSQSLTEKEFEAKIEDQLKVLRLTEEEVRLKVPEPFVQRKEGDEKEDPVVTPEYDKEARLLYDQLEKKFNDPNFKPDTTNDLDIMVATLKPRYGEQVHAGHILIKSSRTDDMKKRSAALNKIRDIKKQLDNGADFEDLAKKYSEDDTTAKNGGDLGFFSRGQMVPEFEKAAFSLPVGGISDVIETEFGYHLIKVDEKRASKKLKYDDIKADLANYLYQKKSHDRYDQYVGELKKKADVKILVDPSTLGGTNENKNDSKKVDE